MKILYICGREPSYTRNSVILKGLDSQNIKVIKCTSMANNYPKRYVEVLLKYLLNINKDYDVVFIGFLGQPLVPIIKRVTNKPIIFYSQLKDPLKMLRALFEIPCPVRRLPK